MSNAAERAASIFEAVKGFIGRTLAPLINKVDSQQVRIEALEARLTLLEDASNRGKE